MKRILYILPITLLAMTAFTVTSCDDMLDMGNEDVLYADENHLTQGADTVSSYVGILLQLQKIAVRTNLFGELRGDLVVVNANADEELKGISNFAINDSNAYNNPRDYYAIINNCNYYLAKADTALYEQRVDPRTGWTYDLRILQAEYCAIRAIRAWVYLQLGQIYGYNIPLVTEPLLSLKDADNAFTSARRVNLLEICDYFIEDLQPYLSWFNYPTHHNVYGGNMPSRMSVFPIYLVYGDLYLWRSALGGNQVADAWNAAYYYYRYIDWQPTDLTVSGRSNDAGYKQKTALSRSATYWYESCFSNGSFVKGLVIGSSNAYWSTNSFGSYNDEVITAIGMDSLSTHYNKLRTLYSYDTSSDKVEASISPSQPCYDYSDSQVYAEHYQLGNTKTYAMGYVMPGTLTEDLVSQHYIGDLRLPANINLRKRGENDFESQHINKADAEDVIIYRKGDLYLRMAEALNAAKQPKFALAILTKGLDNTVIRNEVLKYCNSEDSLLVSYFDFPTTYFRTYVSTYLSDGTPEPKTDERDIARVNQLGLHGRGSGYAIDNPYYYPASTDAPKDSSAYPQRPPVYVYQMSMVGDSKKAYDNLKKDNTEFLAWLETTGDIEPLDLDAIVSTERRNALTAYNDQLKLYSDSIQADWRVARDAWYKSQLEVDVVPRQMAVLDSLLDVESALETPFEGFRFGALMRAAYRSGNPGAYMAEKIGRRDPSLAGRVANPDNWFARWKGMIGR